MRTKNKNEILSEIIALAVELADNGDSAEPSVESPAQVEMLSIKECAGLVRGLSEHSLRILIAQGKLPCVRTGQGLRGKILINKADLLAYFQS